jgi:hypothetical protein
MDASSASRKMVCLPSRSKLILFKEDGVGVEARGKFLGSRSCMRRGALTTKGGNLVVVVVVVVTTVVCVAGAKENCPRVLSERKLVISVEPIGASVWLPCIMDGDDEHANEEKDDVDEGGSLEMKGDLTMSPGKI